VAQLHDIYDDDDDMMMIIAIFCRLCAKKWKRVIKVLAVN